MSRILEAQRHWTYGLGLAQPQGQFVLRMMVG
jgi:hypothetical protein